MRELCQSRAAVWPEQVWLHSFFPSYRGKAFGEEAGRITVLGARQRLTTEMVPAVCCGMALSKAPPASAEASALAGNT